jgi:hypothetical protein
LRAARYLKKPGAKQFEIPKLSGLPVNAEHYFPRQGPRRGLGRVRAFEKTKPVAVKNTEQRVKRILAALFQNPFLGVPLLEIRHRSPSLPRLPFLGCLVNHTLAD